MKTKALLLLFSFMILLPTASQGQLRNMLRDKLNSVINDESENESADTEGVLDSSSDAAVEIEKNQQDNSAQTDYEEGNEDAGQQMRGFDLSRLLGSDVSIKHNDAYNFSLRYFMQMESYEDDEEVKMDFIMYYSPDSPTIDIETKALNPDEGSDESFTSSMIMDAENKCFLMLTNVNNQRMGFISVIPDEETTPSQDYSEPSEDVTPSDLIKTGNTRIIAGYECQEYTYTDMEENTTQKVWLSKDVELNIDRRGLAKAGMPDIYDFPGTEGGVIMAMESFDANGKLVGKSETKEINQKVDYTISIKEYTLTQLNIPDAEDQ